MAKEYKKVLKNAYIDNCSKRFTESMQDFLDRNPNIKIVYVINHDRFNVTVIYEEMIEVKNDY